VCCPFALGFGTSFVGVGFLLIYLVVVCILGV